MGDPGEILTDSSWASIAHRWGLSGGNFSLLTYCQALGDLGWPVVLVCLLTVDFAVEFEFLRFT